MKRFSNGSFEKGDTLADVLLWHRMAGTPAVLCESAGWEIDSGEAFHGSRSLKTATGAPLVLMEEVWEPIPQEEPWVFSVYLKAERDGVPCELSVTLWWKFCRETVSARVELTTEWKRHEVVVQGIPKLERRSSDIQGAVNFRIAPLEKAAVWVDAAQWTRQTDASEDVREGPKDEDAPKWELPEIRVISRSEQSTGNWSGSVPLRVWRDGEGESSRQPVAVGVPFGRGVWNGGGSVRLFAENGREIPAQTEILTQWENGQSAQMLGVFFTDKLEAGWRDYTLQIDASPSAEQADDSFAWRAQPPDRQGLLWGGITPLLGAASLRGIGVDGTVYDSEWDGAAKWKVERDGPLHRVIRCAGRLVSREGSVRLRSLYWRVAEADGEDAEAMIWYDPESGEYQPGRFLLSLESRKILVHAPEAWQRHPSALARKGGEWRGYLWPDAPAKALAFPRGLSLTREFWLREVPGTPDDLAAWDADPIGIAAPEWWANTAPFAASDVRRFPFVESRLGGRRLLDSLAPENIEATRAYGVFDFGDNHGDGGWGNLESFNDWCALLAGLRGGDEIALRAGLRGARHYRDIDIHQVSGACYEHTFNHVAGNADMSHAWPDGVALHYLLTGSKRSQEIIRLHGEYTLALSPKELAKGLRTLGRYLMNLAEGYQLTGDARFRQRFDEQVRIARKLLAEDRENPDRSIFSYIGSWKTRRLVPFHAWYGIAALQKMEALTGDRANALKIQELQEVSMIPSCDFLLSLDAALS